MYAINHAATALLLKKKFPAVEMIWLLISVQLIELLGPLQLSWPGVFYVEHSVVHLGFLAWSHSIFSTLSWQYWRGLLSTSGSRNGHWECHRVGHSLHIILDLALHEQDIQLTPFSTGLAFGLNIQSIPLLAIIVETGYGIFCWWYFKE